MKIVFLEFISEHLCVCIKLEDINDITGADTYTIVRTKHMIIYTDIPYLDFKTLMNYDIANDNLISSIKENKLSISYDLSIKLY